MYDLAILIPYTTDRRHYFDRLSAILYKQIGGRSACIMTEVDNYEMSTGAKRNELVKRAATIGAKYIAHFDSDDLPSHHYVDKQLEVVASGKDCGSLWGNIYFGGEKGYPFHHSIRYASWFTNETEKKYERMPNHLNCLKTEIAVAFPFPDITLGEDHAQSQAMADAGAIKTEHEIDEVIYHYWTGQRDSQQEQDYYKYISEL